MIQDLINEGQKIDGSLLTGMDELCQRVSDKSNRDDLIEGLEELYEKTFDQPVE